MKSKDVSSESDAGPQLVLMFGGPGAGKGTQAQLLSTALGMPHISSGDLLRQDHSRRAQTAMQSGELLPDDHVARVVLERLQQPDAQRGAILDGFPRTLAQAQILDRWLEEHGGTVRSAVFLDVPDDELARRLIERGTQSGRADDQEHAVPKRLEVFTQEFPPLLDHYAKRGLLRVVDGKQDIDSVHRQIIEALASPVSRGS